MAGFKNRLFGQKVSPDVKKIFDDLQDGKKTVNPLDPLQPSKVSHHLGESLPFVRMWSAVDIRVSGSADEDAQIRVFSVNENREDSYSSNKPPLGSLTTDMGSDKVKYVKQLSEKQVGLQSVDGNPYLKPPAGITSMTSKTEGSIGALQRTVVEFIVHNKQDFDNIFLPYFLRPGSTVCVDFGRTFDTNFQLYDPLAFLNATDTEMELFDDFIYGEEKGYLATHFGYVKTTIGNVVKYNATINNVGSFECSLEIVSRNTALIDKPITNDSDLKYIFNNAFDELLISALAAYNDPENDIAATNLDQVFNRKNIYSEIDFNEEAAEFFKSSEINANADGTISDYASQVGIFHQDLSNLARGFQKDGESDGKEKTYITLGRLEDMFLNSFVSGVSRKTDENKVFIRDRDNNYEIQYDSRKGVCRWDKLLFEIQTAKLSPRDNLPSFMLPNKWADSYNTRLAPDYEPPDDEDLELGGRFVADEKDDKDYLLPDESSTKDTRFPGIHVMPIRELFISTDVIKRAFASQDTVDKALQSILDQLNSDSNNVWNLKLIATNESKTNFCVHDCNLMGPQPDLIFDVTSDKSIVSQCDLKFVEAKGGLASMIAISNQANQTYIDQHFLGNLMHLNALNRPVLSDNNPESDQFVRIKSLPFKGDFNRGDEAVSAIGVDRTELKSIILKPSRGQEINLVDDIAWKKYVSQKNKKIKELDKSAEELSTDEASGAKKKDVFKKVIDENVDLSGSERDYLLDQMRLKHFGSSKAGSVAPILPLELNLSIYGNDWLQIGDCFNINYLPKYYKDRVMFQIVGIEHTLDTNGWQTNYNSVMKLDPRFKSIATGKVHAEDPLRKQAIDDEQYDVEFEEQVVVEEDKGLFDITTGKVDQEKTTKARKAMSKGGTTKLLSVFGNPLKFDVFRRKIGKPTGEQFSELTKREKGKLTWFATKVKDTQHFRHGKNIAYNLALRQAMFEIVFQNVENSEFSGENFNEMKGDDWFKYVDSQYHNQNPLQGVMDVYSDDEMDDIIDDFNPSPDVGFSKKEEELMKAMNLAVKSKGIPIGALKQKTINKAFVDELNDVDLDGFLTPRLVRNFALQVGLRDTNGDGTENQIIFQLRNPEIDIQKVITIPEIALGGDNPKQFIRHINLNYRLFYAEGGPLAMFP